MQRIRLRTTVWLQELCLKKGIPSADDIRGYSNILLVLDDLMSDMSTMSSDLFTKYVHHQNLSVLYIVQNIFNNAKNHRTLSLNGAHSFTCSTFNEANKFWGDLPPLPKDIQPKAYHLLPSFVKASQTTVNWQFLLLKKSCTVGQISMCCWKPTSIKTTTECFSLGIMFSNTL